MNPFLPLQIFSDWLSFSFLDLAENSLVGQAVSFFVYDSLKIAILLLAIIFAVALLRSYLPAEKIKRILSHKFEFIGNILAALFGTVTPFCSCSAIPLFVGLVESGVPLGVTFSYLVSAPMVNEIAAILLLGLFGWKIALLYIFSGVIIAIATGIILGRLKLEHWVEDYVWQQKTAAASVAKTALKFRARVKTAWQYSWNLFQNVFPYVLIGVAVGAFIHGYAPENFLAILAGKSNWWAVPLAVLIGVPLYSNAAGTIPIVSSLIEKGLPLGTSLAFMMAVTALSLPEMIILRKILKPKLLAIYIAILTLGIIFTGYLFNWVL